jgi:hypothetical protein
MSEQTPWKYCGHPNQPHHAHNHGTYGTDQFWFCQGYTYLPSPGDFVQTAVGLREVQPGDVLLPDTPPRVPEHGIPLKPHPYVWPDLPPLTVERVAELFGVPVDMVVYKRDALGRTVVGGVGQTADDLLAEVAAAPDVQFTTQDEFLTALADLLDGALHPDTCHIDTDATYCSCYIKAVREALPKCTATRPVLVPFAGGVNPMLTDHGPQVLPKQVEHWHCVRTAHPASPNQHTFANATGTWTWS